MSNEKVIIVVSGVVVNSGTYHYDSMHVHIDYAVRLVNVTGELQYTKKTDRRNKKVITYYVKSWRSTDRKNIIPENIIVIPQVEENKMFDKSTSVLQTLMTSITLTLTLIIFYKNWD